ncbi:hypothetical protein AB0F64_39750 [Streptomyces sp. NPDC026294]|uniref:hypothetical protein n=1 Tax=Streptomyces sp. NPDC026294 TaxID=3155362 RepID=UPI0033C2CC90
MLGFTWGGRAIPRWRRYALRASGLGDTAPDAESAGDYVTVDLGDRRETVVGPALTWWVSLSVSGPGISQPGTSGGRAESSIHAVNWLHSSWASLGVRPGHPAELFFEALDEAAVRLDYARRLTADCTGISVTVTECGVCTTLSIGCTVETTAEASFPGTPVVTLSREAV